MKSITILMLLLALSMGAYAEEAGKSVALFNGVDFEGWKLYVPDENFDVTENWSVENGVIKCKGSPAGYMRTEKEYEHYKLLVEWRWPEQGGNSGVLLHVNEPDAVWPKSIEAQLQSGHAGDFWVIGGASFKEHRENDRGRVDGRRTVKLEKSSEKPRGEWNRYEIVCQGDTIKVYVNGVLQNVATECSVTKGYIGLQSEGTPIEFRKVELEALSE